MTEITSKNNEKINLASKLLRKSERDEKCLFICDSYKMINEFIEKNSFSLKEIFIRKEFLEKYEFIISKVSEEKIFIINESLEKKLSENKSLSGIVAIFKKKLYNKKIFSHDFLIALDVIQDPLNLGTVLRSAKAFDIPIIISENSCDLYSPKTIKGSMGGIDYENIYLSNNLLTDLKEYKEKGYNIVSSALDESSIKICNYDISQKTVMIVGNEGNGIRKEILDYSDKKIIIPMKNSTQSLNAASAANILMWEKIR